MHTAPSHCAGSRLIARTVAIVAATCAYAQGWQTEPLPRPRSQAAQAFDIARGRTVLFGGNWGIDFDDTWEHDGSRWTRVATANAPTARYGAGMAYDILRQRIVLFGGHNFIIPFADTYEFDGTNWTQRFPAASPSPRSRPGMAYDLFRARTVLHGGSNIIDLADTWEFDGTNWIARPTQTTPPASSNPISFDIARSRMVLLHSTGDTWLYDGLDWNRLQTQHRPVLHGFGQCYDLARSATVVLGGAQATGSFSNDVWQFDGTDWTATNPGNGPAGRGNASVSGDLNSHVLMFGGGNSTPTGETWEWSQGTWRALHRAPPPRDSAPLVFDQLRNRFVLAGGAHGTFDTWERVGSTWTEIATTTQPAVRSGQAVVYDAARGRVTMFGGRTSTFSSYFGDTWFYDGTNWSQATPTASPSPRIDHAMVYDPVRRRVLLFGGYNPNQFSLADTWAFDGSNWSQLAPARSPFLRSLHALAYDARRDVVVLFGGAAGTSIVWNDTWEFDGQNWTERTNVGAPSARIQHAMIYDPQAGCVLMFGGRDVNNLVLTDSWQYDGVSWTQLQPNAGLAPDEVYGLSCDATRGRLVAHGVGFAETWDFVPASVATVARFGRGCADNCGVPTLDPAPGSIPALGTQFTLRVTSQCAQPAAGVLAFGFDLAQWNGAALPVDLAPIGIAGCNLWIAPDAGWLFPLAFQGSVATFTVQVPANPLLAGLVAGAQAATLDATGTGALTNAAVMRVF